MKKDNRVKSEARTECDSTGSRAAQCSTAGTAIPDKPRCAYLARKFFPHLGEYHGTALVEELMRLAPLSNARMSEPRTSDV
jgi:hypothetical protein